MTVYVDDLRTYSTVAPAARRYGWQWCHLLADTEIELHAFALGLGLKRGYFQEHDRLPALGHYDLTPTKRALAIKNGAQPFSMRDVLEKLVTRALETDNV